jgi:tagatose 1,6-diphosphate aldolase
MLRLGKERGLQRLATPRGHFDMVALDQRPPLEHLIARKKGIATEAVAFADMVAIKRLLAKTFGDHASAMLLDPNFAIPGGIDLLSSKTGLIVTLEDHRFRETRGGRFSAAIENWNVEKIRCVGADAVKVLAWYRPDAAADVKEHQKAFVRRIGDDCRRLDIPFILELLVYPFPGTVEHAESAENKAELVIESVREFARPQYGVDLFKLESPIAASRLPARDGSPAAQRAESVFGEIGGICEAAGTPWVMLSAGVTPEAFALVLDYAYAARANGFLAGRVIWMSALEAFPDLNTCEANLIREGVPVLRRLSDLTAESAAIWGADFAGLAAVSKEGDFTRAYL